MAEQNSAASEETSAASEEITAQVEEVYGSAQSLADLAAALDSSVSIFKTNGNHGKTEEAFNSVEAKVGSSISDN